LLYDQEQTFTRLIQLYWLSMKHNEIYQCLKILSNQLSINPIKSYQALHAVIRDHNSRPRTLKQMCRVVIYNSIEQRPALHVSKLHLPAVLREYILNFEP
jgi:hypothetical protein